MPCATRSERARRVGYAAFVAVASPAREEPRGVVLMAEAEPH